MRIEMRCGNFKTLARDACGGKYGGFQRGNFLASQTFRVPAARIIDNAPPAAASAAGEGATLSH